MVLRGLFVQLFCVCSKPPSRHSRPFQYCTIHRHAHSIAYPTQAHPQPYCRDGKLFDYRGDRSAANLRDWGLSLLPNHVKVAKSKVRCRAEVD